MPRSVVAEDIEDWLTEPFLSEEAAIRAELHEAFARWRRPRVAFDAQQVERQRRGAVGASALAELCGQIEHQADQGSLEGLASLLERPESAAAVVRAAPRGDSES